MRRVLILLILSAAFHGLALSQGAPPITFVEQDGSPRKTAPTKIIVSNGTLSCSGGTCTLTTGGGSVGGSDTQLQYNNAGALGGISGATTDGTNVTFGSANLRATSPRITTGVLDSGGNSMFSFTATGSAVNGFSFTNSATGNAPVFGSVGSDTNIPLVITPQGTGRLESTGPLRLSGTGVEQFILPLGGTIPTKINVPLYNPGAFGQIVAMGLDSGAHSTARVIMVADARSAGHQASIAVLSPDENSNFGFSWDGSNTIAKIIISTAGGIIKIDAPGGTQVSSIAFTNLGTPADGTYIYCTDCQVTSGADNTCTSGGGGAFAFRVAGAWKCLQ